MSEINQRKTPSTSSPGTNGKQAMIIDQESDEYKQLYNTINIQNTMKLFSKLRIFSLLFGIVVVISLLVYVQTNYMAHNVYHSQHESSSIIDENKTLSSFAAVKAVAAGSQHQQRLKYDDGGGNHNDKALNLEQWIILGSDIFLIFVLFIHCGLWNVWPANVIMSLFLLMCCTLIVGLAVGLHMTRFLLP